MKRVTLFLFVLLLVAGTPWMAFAGLGGATALRNSNTCYSQIIAKGIALGDAEERAEEEDTRETEEDEDKSSHLDSNLGIRFLPIQIKLQFAHQLQLFKEHHCEIVVPPPRG